MTIEVRRARPDDAAAFRDLLAQLGYEWSEASVCDGLARYESSPADEAFVAVQDGEVVGFVTVHVTFRLKYGGDAAELGAMVVHEPLRGQGVGRALVEAFEEEARRRGCVLAFLTSASPRRDAHAFYRGLGYEETGVRFTKRLP